MTKETEALVEKKKKRRKIPKELIYEMRRGNPIYYRDYDKVLAGEKTLEEVMGSSGLQSYLIILVLNLLLSKLSGRYVVLSNEVGFKFSPKSWRNLDIAVFGKEKVKDALLKDEYIAVPPKVVIEVDTKADLKKYGDVIHYINEKTDDLLDSGVERVIWVLTKERKVMVAEKGKRWFITDWDDEIDYIETIKFSVNQLLKT
ncbi:MAG: Uma2 family endonuclease [Candidatus Brocadiaceae bacterium]|nr:Uma2 family endonuclease [Candidatus Brocadiaceae bacterium]